MPRAYHTPLYYMSQTPVPIRVDNAEHIPCHVKTKNEKNEDANCKLQMIFYGYICDLTSEFGSVFRAWGTVTWTENCELQTRLRIEMIRSDVHND